jgi:hypothetical protein
MQKNGSNEHQYATTEEKFRIRGEKTGISNAL